MPPDFACSQCRNGKCMKCTGELDDGIPCGCLACQGE